ncbi:TauD/TfdA dioxygenase family protein [Azonexus sp. IMCC34842]|uniref:TauD/TfdA dioxygenase family protein n=1 Tax=Azonexus sp. IMCC34842 TaxID=3420950 RepID=UPI003D0E6840
MPTSIHSPFTRFRAEPYSPNIGAIIHGLDLTKTQDETTRDQLRTALARFEVLFFRNQPIDATQHIEVAGIFGNPDGAKAYFPQSDANPLIEVIETKAGGPRYTTDQWHVDVSYLAAPPAGAVLHAQVLPESGGDTLWSSGRRVYAALDPGLAARLEGLSATHSIERSAWPEIIRSQENGEERFRQIRAERVPVSHPVIRSHPVTGEKLVFVNPKYVDRIDGLSRKDSDNLLDHLFGQFERPEFQARLRWEKDTVAVWDNLSTVHYAVADYLPAYRRMHRVTF